MFGIFGITKDANAAYGYLANFVEYFDQSIGLFGFDRGSNILIGSEWVAGPRIESERGFKTIHFRLAVPFETFFGAVTDEVGIFGAPSVEHGVLRVQGAERFLGFALNAYSETCLVQVAAFNPIRGRATARAAMLMSRFKARGAADISEVVRGRA